jgi:hypothetical protein
VIAVESSSAERTITIPTLPERRTVGPAFAYDRLKLPDRDLFDWADRTGR